MNYCDIPGKCPSCGEHTYCINAKPRPDLDEPPDLAELIAATIAEHATTYTERPGEMWSWKCACGQARSFVERDACKVLTREHWGSVLAERLTR